MYLSINAVYTRKTGEQERLSFLRICYLLEDQGTQPTYHLFTQNLSMKVTVVLG